MFKLPTAQIQAQVLAGNLALVLGRREKAAENPLIVAFEPIGSGHAATLRGYLVSPSANELAPPRAVLAPRPRERHVGVAEPALRHIPS